VSDERLLGPLQHAFPVRSPFLPFTAWFVCWLAASAGAQNQAQHRALLVPMPAEVAWQDLAFLAALPAASLATGGVPVVLKVGAEGALSPEVKEFLARYRPDRVSWIGSGPEDATIDGALSERLAADSADSAACTIAEVFFARSNRAVVVLEEDYGGALAAAVLAARLRVPLFFASGTGLSTKACAVLERIGVSALLVVGDLEKSVHVPEKLAVERLREPADVARWMQRHALPVSYLAAAAPADRRSGHTRKLSLSAAVLAAGRQGALVTIGSDDAPVASAAAAQATLARFRATLGATPEYLCIAAMPEAIPMAVLPSGEGIDTDPPSDLAYGNVDADPFIELALGRFVAEDGAAGTLLAARSLAYTSLITPASADRFALAGWERVCAPLFENVGFAPPLLQDDGPAIAADSPFTSVAVLVHNAHASWLQIGSSYAHDSRVLLAPCLVESAGCSPASLDQDAEGRSVALRLLRNGAIAFVGNVRRAIAQQELFRSEFWNAVLAGQSLGQASRSAENRMLVSVLANGETEHGLHRYELYNEALYGDPALVLHLPCAPKSAPARTEVHGRDVIVHAPAKWWRSQESVPAEWNYNESPAIYAWRGAGVGVESSWDAEHRRNREELVFTAEVRTSRRIKGLEVVKPPPAPLGWDGRFFVDEHGDGTRSVYFRVRMIDVDAASGRIVQQIDSLSLRLD
jgi:Peptidase family C25